MCVICSANLVSVMSHQYNKDGDFSGLVSKICSNWTCTNVDNVSISYVIPGNSKVSLRNKYELEMIFSLVSDFDIRSIELCI